MNNTEWGGSGIEKVTYDYIINTVKHGSTFIELGAGKVSTRELSKIFNLYSIEQDKNYCDIYSQAKYIYAPFKDGWYDIEALKNNLPPTISAILVDGPAGEGNRRGILDNIELFDLTPDAIIIFHDTYRSPEHQLAYDVSNKLCMKLREYAQGDHFIVVSSRSDI